MRSKVLDIVEKARFDLGRGVYRGEHYGDFIFKRGEAYLCVIAGKGEEGVWPFPGEPWDHVSVSVRGEKRCPTWDEMKWIKSLFFDDEELVIQFHPPASNYVNDHDYVLHLWRPTASVIPMPPMQCV